jgi:uncharacterized small protein (DUF1192 family)
MRFSLKHHGQLSCVEHCPEGEYVLHSDYARLKAEVEAWKDMVADSGVACNERARENQDLENQIERLKSEVERLTDELNYRKAIAIRVGIEAAKEGKQSND